MATSCGFESHRPHQFVVASSGPLGKIPDIVDQDVDSRISNGQCGFRDVSRGVAVAVVADDVCAVASGRNDLVARRRDRVTIDVCLHHMRARSGQSPG